MIYILFTFGFGRRREDAVGVLVDMDYVASDELGNLVRLGFVLYVQFAYECPVSSTYCHTSKHVQRYPRWRIGQLGHGSMRGRACPR